MTRVLVLMGALCLLYYIAIILYAGIHAAFAPFWFILGICFFAAAAVNVFLPRINLELWMILKNIGLSVAAVLFAFFVLVEIRLVCEGRRSPKQGADYLVVLGAKVKKTVPCKTLHRRIKRAAVYLKENPHTKAITSGGMGPGEAITEAECMARYLVKMGVDGRRITKEERSVNTNENLEFSLSMIPKSASVVIVTSDFHIYRAVAVGRRKGFKNISGAGSYSDPLMVVNYYMREFFAVVKYKLNGDI